MTIRAHFDGKVFIPVHPVDLQKDQLVELEVRNADPETEDLRPGSPAAVLKAMRAPPHVRSEDVDEMLRHIKEAQRPIDYTGIFDDLADK
jgi:hypothetical protein